MDNHDDFKYGDYFTKKEESHVLNDAKLFLKDNVKLPFQWQDLQEQMVCI